MSKLESVVEIVSGSPQFRIIESLDVKAPIYTYYSQSDIEDDLRGMKHHDKSIKQVRTFDNVNTLSQGDVVFSLISGKSAIVSANHEGYLYTQNYIKLLYKEKLDSRYLVYLLNEDRFVKKQFQKGLQGSQVLKYTLKQVKELDLPKLPTFKKQRVIGELYFMQLRLEALKNRVVKFESILLMDKLKEVSKDE